MSVILTILIGLIIMAIFILVNIGVFSIFDDKVGNEGCMGFGFIIAILVVIVLVLYGIRACAS